MKRFIAAGAGAALLGLAAVSLPSTTASAQAPDVLMLRGPGASIGVTVRDVTPEDAARAKLAQPFGVYIESVREGSPAAAAGFQAGDIVTDFDGERVRSVRQFTRLVQDTPPRRVVEAVVVRGTSRQTLRVTPESAGRFAADARDAVRRGLELRGRVLPEPPGDFTFDLGPELFRFRDLVRGPALGMTVIPLGDQLAEYFGVKEGALVSSVEPNSAAAAAGLKAGDVITAVNGRTVNDAGDVVAEVRRAEPGDGLDLSVTRDRKSLMLKATIPESRERSGRRGLPV